MCTADSQHIMTAKLTVNVHTKVKGTCLRLNTAGIVVTYIIPSAVSKEELTGARGGGRDVPRQKVVRAAQLKVYRLHRFKRRRAVQRLTELVKLEKVPRHGDQEGFFNLFSIRFVRKVRQNIIKNFAKTSIH